MPAPDKAREPGYRTELRLRVSAASKPDAKAIMQTLTSSYRSLDGSNGLRPHRVFRPRAFDRDLSQRRPPSGRGPVLVAEEMARLFHLPALGIAMDEAATRVAPARTVPLSGKTLCFAAALGNAPTTISRKTYERFWGPRTDDILRAAILTLLRKPGATLCEVPLLLLDPKVRQRLTAKAKLQDPVGLKPFWDEYERLAEGQRLQLIGP